MRFTRLRLTGFKSFTDSTELLIEPGLTGIVGPNGCGKSNLVEALQWAMGESSARRLRGGDMDDVIFGGTTTRPSRNIASVIVSLDNRERTAPVMLNDSDEIEIERRIERGKGSTYRVNGREQRARDVQLLFADAASGAHSTALIGQGRIGWLINARPAERRQLLEEAAGISGLQTRRHEAELRLSAAETNLVRLSDIAQSLIAQIERLKKQARQAERYRRVSEQIRLAEALLLYRRWLDRGARLSEAAARLVEAEAQVAATLGDLEAAQG
ncbi:MAG: AAA family ATPase, partial [Aliidongia sp.]